MALKSAVPGNGDIATSIETVDGKFFPIRSAWACEHVPMRFRHPSQVLSNVCYRSIKTGRESKKLILSELAERTQIESYRSLGILSREGLMGDPNYHSRWRH